MERLPAAINREIGNVVGELDDDGLRATVRLRRRLIGGQMLEGLYVYKSTSG
jgi:hypothetical protein